MATFLTTLFILVSILLVMVVLLQKGRGGGLGAAFGGGSGSAFGTRTGDVFTWVTIVLTALFLLLAVGTMLAYRIPSGEGPTRPDRPVPIHIRTRPPEEEVPDAQPPEEKPTDAQPAAPAERPAAAEPNAPVPSGE